MFEKCKNHYLFYKKLLILPIKCNKIEYHIDSFIQAFIIRFVINKTY